ncbi:MAG: hypothetical protein Q9200_000335 [Gallowayella weberi]
MLVSQIFVAPGNGGTAQGLDKVSNVPIAVDDFPGLVEFAEEMNINLIVPGPELPLVKGVTDYFKKSIPNIHVFGPSKDAARLEGSKTFAKDFMVRFSIPTARHKNFSNYEEARQHIDEVQYEIVIKASGLAAGKGVILPASKSEAQDALKRVMVGREFAEAGDEVVIEEYLRGDELSFLTFCDGYTIRSLPAAQDHKQLNDGDCGPNTGGMGAYAPAPLATPELVEEIHRTVLQPTIDAMRKSEAHPFVGLLFTGLMITEDGPRVLEYNVRFGDPETQTLLPLMSMDTDLAEIMMACTEGRLDGIQLKTTSSSSVTVVAAAGGYPETYRKGDTININQDHTLIEEDHIFHAGTALTKGSFKTAGGRVIAATSTADSLTAALTRAYNIMESIDWSGKHYRKDIAHRALKAATPSQQTGLKSGMTYAEVGVSISAGNELVERIKAHVKSTARPGASGDLGGFGGVFDLANAGYKEVPYLVTGTDGVGTKLQIAQATNTHDTIGIDLVAMNVNDLIVQGAKPLFFTDVFSCSRLDVSIAEDVIKGVCRGCKEAQCALIGGETAEMPDFFLSGRYDVVGACTGAIARDKKLLPDTNAMKEGDILLGLASDGCHSNGFSLIRKIIEKATLAYTDRAPWNQNQTVGQSLLTPTRIYVKPVLRLLENGLVKGMAHITGGGLWENVPRMLPRSLAAELDAALWQCPAVLKWLKQAGRVNDHEFAQTFNTGLGMILVVDQSMADEAQRQLLGSGERVSRIGHLVQRRVEGCLVRNMNYWNVP